MKYQWTLAASALTVGFILNACNDSTVTEPTAVRPSFASGGTTQCVGVLPSGTYGNVEVPPGETCIFSPGITVLGSVRALKQSSLHFNDEFEVKGDVDADKADNVFILATLGDGTIGGSIRIRKNENPGARVRISGVLLPDGDITVEKAHLLSLIVEESLLLKGNINVDDNASPNVHVVLNRVAQDLQVSRNRGAEKTITENTVGQNLRVFKNADGATTVMLNTVGQILQCFKNDDPVFVGGPNPGAQQVQGQCFL